MDQETLIQRFEEHRPRLAAYLVRLVLRVTVAEELVQETALRALVARASAPQEEYGLRLWLFRIATNLALDFLRRHSTVRQTPAVTARRAATWAVRATSRPSCGF